MIIEKNIKINVTNRNKKNLSSKGYNINDSNILIKISDLSINSHNKIKVICDNCHLEKLVVYKNYMKQTKNDTEIYLCSKCKYIKIKNTTKKRYGEESIFMIKEYQDKIKKTMLDKYGTENALKNTNIKNKMIHNLKIKYGVDNVSKIQEIKNKKIGLID